MSNNAIGSVLVIPEGLIKDLEETDKKIAKIQETSRETAKVFNQSFASMNTSVGTLGNSLDQIITKLNAIAGGATAVAGATRAIGTTLTSSAQGAETLNASITGVSESLNRLMAHFKGTGQVIPASLMEARFSFKNLQEAMNFKDGNMLSDLKSAIEEINKALKNEKGTLTKVEQDALIERKRKLQEEVKEAERTYQERIVNFQKMCERLIAAEQSLQAKLKKERESNALKQNTTYEGSLAYSQNVTTYKEMATAVKYLNEALANLSRTEGDFEERSATLRARIEQLKNEMKAITASDKEIERQNLRSLNAEVRREEALRKVIEARAKQKEYEKNTTFEGSLKFAENVNTYSQITKAIEYLIAAKKNLSIEDGKYTQKLDTLNTRIQELLRVKKEFTTTETTEQALAKQTEAEIQREVRLRQEQEARIQAVRKAKADLARVANYKENTTVEGALKFADTAQTYNRMAKAVEYLTAAKKKLTLSDAESLQKKDLLDAQIRRLQASMKSIMSTESAEDVARKKQTESFNAQIKLRQDAVKRLIETQNKNYEKWKTIDDEINRLASRQNTLNSTIKNYQMILDNIKSGRGGNITAAQIEELKAARQEHDANIQLISQLRQKQMQITTNNQELQRQINLLQQLKNASGRSLADERSADTLKRMSEYYRELEKSSASAERERAKRARETDREYQSQLRAEEQKRRKIEQTTEAQRRFNEEQRKQKQAMYNSVFSVGNVSFAGAMTEAKYASSINERTQAIRMLEAARAKLNTTDAQGRVQLEQLNTKIKELNAANRQAIASSQELNNSHSKLMDTAGQLKRAFALVFSVSQIRSYIGQIAKVRGEFELQQRSLEAILQNKTKADEVLSKTVALAVQSPFLIKDLISYTKQLAAYRIESNKLYDTTKRLADVSAGLGVDMQRLILAYGQVKAAAYLRGTEVRQFTEAGINLYGELQAYFKEVKGEAYTTAQIVDMISKRMVTFADVEAIFKRITDQGGIFYNMQAIQAETLQGKIANLKDSVDIMLNDIGYANEGIYKFAIDRASVVIRNWKTLSDIGLRIIEILALIKIHSMATGKAMGITFSEIAKFQTLKGVGSTMQLVSISFTNFGRALKAAGVMAKTAMAQFLPLLALTEIYQAVSRIWDSYSEYNKTIRESTQAYADEIAKINKLTNEIRDLQKARKEASDSNNKDFDYKQNWEMQKSYLQSLYDRLKEKKLEIPLEISKVTQKNINNVLEDAKSKLELGYKMIADAQRIVAYNISRYYLGSGQGLESIKPDNFQTDMNDLENAAADVRAYSTRIQASIALIGEQYNNLSESSKKAYDSIRDGAKNGEVDVNYVIRAYSELNNIFYKYDAGNKAIRYARSQFQDYAESVMGLKTQIEGLWQFNDQKDTATKQLAELFNKIDGMYGAELAKMKPFEIKAEWNEVATAAKLQDLERYILLTIASKKYKFKVEGDEDELAKQLNWVDDYIRKFFAGRKYSTTISLQTNVDAMEDFIKKGDAEAEIARKAKSFVERYSKSVYKNVKKITVNDKILNMFIGSPYNFKIGDKIDKDTLLKRAKEILAKSTDLAMNGYGINPFDKNGTKAAKAQRDILSEQIALLKEMQTRYEKLQPLIGDEEAAKRVKAYYAESLKYVKMPKGIVNSFVPTKEGVIAAIKKIIPTISDFKKKMDAKNYVAELKIGIDNDSLKTEIDKAKTTLETAFSALDMYNDLRKAGLGDGYIRSMFGDIPKTFEDLQGQIDRTFAGKTGKDWAKLKEEQEKKLQEKIQKYNLDTFKELTKAYKTQLTEQLRLDAWYMEEKMKIMESVSDPTLQKEYLGNLEKQYNQKTSENTWKDFKDSDFYIRMFENLESQSTVMLNAMREKLVSLRTELKNLSPEQLKEIVRQTEEIDNQLIQRNPFKGLAENFKEYVKFAKERKKLEKDYVSSKQKEDSLNATSKAQNEEVTNAKAKYDLAVKTYGANSMQAAEAKLNLATAQKKLDTTLKELVAQGLITEELAKQIREGEESKSKFRKGFEFVSEKLQQVTAGYSDFENMMSNFGIEMPKEIAGTLSGLNQISGGIEKIMSGDVVGGALSAVAGIGNTFGSIFGFGNKDNKLQKEIEKHQEKVERLQKAYDNLKDKMDKAWDATSVIQTTDEMQKNIDSQISSYQAMIRAEEAKKKTDDSKIKEYKEQINELIKQRKELEEQKIQTLGAIGESTYKDAAQEFVDAWVDAYKECSSTIDAIKGKMDELIENMMKKQLMQRAAKKYFEPIFTMFDKMFDKNSAGGELVTEKELETLNKSYGKYLEGFDEFAKQFMNMMGYNPTGSSELSKLQQGIQSMSEETGQALESMLNSIRFFVAQQATDISAIRALLAAGGNVAYSAESTPLLNELRAQSGILNKIYSTLSSVISPNHPKYGYGLKVFMN